MEANVEITPSQAKDVSKEEFHRALQELHNKRKDKPLWTSKRIEEVIQLVEDYKVCPDQLNRTKKHYYYGRKYDVATIGTRKVLISKSNSKYNAQIVPVEDYYSVLTECRRSTSYGSRNKMVAHLTRNNLLVPMPVIDVFHRICLKKRVDSNKDVVPQAEAGAKWLMRFQDRTTKQSYSRPLKSTEPVEVAAELSKIFSDVGCPSTLNLQSDRGREFTEQVTKQMQAVWPGSKIVNASEGGSQYENTEKTMPRSLHKDIKTNRPVGRWPVLSQRKTSMRPSSTQIPYNAVFVPETQIATTVPPTTTVGKVETDKDLIFFTGEVDNQMSIIVSQEDPLQLSSIGQPTQSASDHLLSLYVKDDPDEPHPSTSNPQTNDYLEGFLSNIVKSELADTETHGHEICTTEDSTSYIKEEYLPSNALNYVKSEIFEVFEEPCVKKSRHLSSHE